MISIKKTIGSIKRLQAEITSTDEKYSFVACKQQIYI